MEWVITAILGIWALSYFSSKDDGTQLPKTRDYSSSTSSAPQKNVWDGEINGEGVPVGSKWHNLRQSVLTRDSFRCTKCGDKNNLTVHHRTPLSIGGTNELANLTTLCRQCHEEVHGRSIYNRSFDSDGNYGENYRVPKKVILFQEAINKSEILHIAYTDRFGSHTTREVKPLLLYKENGKNFVRCFCYLRNAERVFRLDKIKVL